MDAPVVYIPGFVPIDEPTLMGLWRDLPWERRPDAPRRECWMNDFGRSYTYGRGQGVRTYDAVPWVPFARELRGLLNGVTLRHYEGCFINGYEGPRDHLGWHADDDPKIDHAAPIAIVSLGWEREIWFRENGSTHVDRLTLEHGSLALMMPGMQQTHQHRIPKNPNVNCGIRISLTYRGLVEPGTRE